MSFTRKNIPIIVVLFLSLLLAAVIFIHDHAYLGDLDVRILHYINKNRLRGLDRFFLFLTNSNTTVTVLAISIVFILSYVKRSKAILFKAIAATCAIATSTFLCRALKYLIARDRPHDTHEFIEDLTRVTTHSFPSGHTTEAFTMATIISLFFRNYKVAIVAYVWAVLIAYSRMVLGVHYPTDIIAAVLLGSMVSILMWRLFLPRTL